MSILEPDETQSAVQLQLFCIAPDAESVFADRSRRFASLSAGHPQGDWLRFLGALSAAQDVALHLMPPLAGPTDEALRQAAEYAMPPLSISSWPLDPAWRSVLRDLLGHLQKMSGSGADGVQLPEPAHRIIAALAGTKSSVLDALARQVLEHRGEGEERAAGLFISAALQVYWTAMAGRLDPTKLVRLEAKRLCPCCGSLPVGSVVRSDGEVAGRRYLHCALCNMQWNLVRVTCVRCDDNGGIAYHGLKGRHPAVRAETCDACDSYLKIYYRDQDPHADPVADDLATLALDVLLDEGQYRRAGPNFFRMPGE